MADFTPYITELDKGVAELAHLRLAWKVQADVVAMREERYQKSRTYLDYTEERANLKELEAEIDKLTADIKGVAEVISAATGYEDRHPNPNITIKEFDVAVITDEPAAKAWAATNAPDLLTLSSKFGGVVKKLTLPFVHRKTEYRAQIASEIKVSE